MANNPYVNKVIKADGTTIIDISDTTATASDVASGKYFYTAAGAKTQGTATGGSGTAIIEDTLDANGGTIRSITTTDEVTLTTKSITANGTYAASSDNVDGYSSVTVNVSGGGGLVYETGTWEPSTDTSRGEILFTNSHTSPPIYVSLTDATDTFSDVTYSNYGFHWLDWWRITGVGMYASSGTKYYCELIFDYKGSTGTSINNTYKKLSQNSDYPYSNISNYPRYWVTPTGFNPYTDSTDRYWRAGRTYKWIAVWAPTT